MTAQHAETPHFHPNSLSAEDCLQALREYLLEGFENPLGRTGSCLLRVATETQDATLFIQLEGETLRFSPTAESDPAAQLILPLATAQQLVADIETVDYRDPDIIGQIRFEGDLELINHIAKALLRPSSEARERLDTATQRQSPAYRITAIERFSQASELQILEALAEGRPLIITDPPLSSDRSAWTLEALAARFGDVPLRVRSADQRQTVAEFIAELRADNRSDRPIIEGHTKAYTEGCALPEAMRPAFVPGYFSLHDYNEPQIWLGSVPTNVPASSLHRDPLDGFLYQIMGRKRLVLYAPDQAPLLYPMKAWNNYQPCWVSPDQPDHKRFPDFCKAQSLEVILHPGELLVQPAGWFHEVSCLDSPTFSVSYFYRH